MFRFDTAASVDKSPEARCGRPMLTPVTMTEGRRLGGNIAVSSESFADAARLGSLWGPGVLEAYALSWRELLGHEHKLARVIVYLQRHTFELLLKRMLSTALQVRKTLHGWGRIATGPTAEDEATLHGTHNLAKIREGLDCTFKHLGWLPTPLAIRELVEVFTEIESQEASRLRYEMVRDKRSKELVKSFPNELDEGKPIYVSCRAIGRQLDDILSAYALNSDDEPPTVRAPLTELQAFFLDYDARWREVADEDMAGVLEEYEKSQGNG